ncbi:MAG: glycosyltransferase family 87 protein [Desulfuromonadaceae bacterium]|nr:glycosyltransferase family 87 protein [Desulfuromonadaceae bacterium]
MVSVQKHIRLSIIIHILLWAALTLWISKEILLPDAIIGSKFGIWVTPSEPGSSYSQLVIIDFPYIFNFVKKAWLGQTTINSGASIYSLENHLKVTSDSAGIKLNYALPFGYSPTMLWLLAPLIYFPNIIAFCLFNLTGLFSVWWMTHPARCRLGFGLLAFFSPLARACFALGQTALLTGAGLLFIEEKTRAGSRATGWRIPILAGIVLWALTAKPPLALTAVAVLVGLRQWQLLLVAGILTVFSTLAISPLLGTNWVQDYLQLIGSYDRISANPAFTWSLANSHMANLRGILSVDFAVADNIASHISSIIWLLALVGISAIGFRARLSEGAIWSLAILSYLLFCPHVTSTEELQIVLLLPLCVRPQNKLGWQELVLLVTIPLLPFTSPAIGLFAGNRMVLFIAKIFLAIFIASTMSRAKMNAYPNFNILPLRG